jgi:hypothetical protein
MSKKLDMMDLTFERLTVVLDAGCNKEGKALWLCRCSCGNDAIVCGRDLRSGNTKSCGCGRAEASKRNLLLVVRKPCVEGCTCLRHQSGGSLPRHGHWVGGSPTGTWRSWQAMLRRCLTPSCGNYSHYGAKGITVCDRWNPAQGGSFENFLADVGLRPEGFSIDRINSKGNYEPANCRWADATTQVINRRTWKRRPDKISDAQVTELRSLRQQGWNHQELATRFGISEPYSSTICSGKSRVAA